MWLFHPLGFCSVVIDRQRPGRLLCRARVKGDLERLFPKNEERVTTSTDRDYRFRVSVPKEAVAARLAELAQLINYDNFKEACPADRHAPYLRVWNVMYDLQLDRAPRRRRRRRITYHEEAAAFFAQYEPWR